jgi:hypothetical protein
VWNYKGKHRRTEPPPRCLTCIIAGTEYGLHPRHPHRIGVDDGPRCECWCARLDGW